VITLEQARSSQLALQEQGTRLLEAFKIGGIVGKLGEFGLQGSFIYGLMVKPDIDARVYCDEPDINQVAEIAAAIMTLPNVIRTNVVNYSSYPPDPGQPEGIYLGIRYDFENVLWNFDIWIISPANELGAEFNDLGSIDPSVKNTILLLKYRLKELGLYPGSSKIIGSFSSADLYRAVVRDGIRDADRLIEWRRRYPIINKS